MSAAASGPPTRRAAVIAAALLVLALLGVGGWRLFLAGSGLPGEAGPRRGP